jgi:hypothetical protein
MVVTILVLARFPAGVILARGCRAKNPGILVRRGSGIRDSSRAPDTRTGMTGETAPE